MAKKEWLNKVGMLTLMLIFFTILFTALIMAILGMDTVSTLIASIIAIALASFAVGKVYGFVFRQGINSKTRLRVALWFVIIQLAIAINN